MSKGKKQKQEQHGTLNNPLEYAPKFKAYNKDIAENTATAFKGYIPFFFWWPLVRTPGSKFGKKCANQGLILTILSVIFALITFLLSQITTGGIGSYKTWQLVGMAFAVIIIAFTVNGFLSTSEGNFTQVPIFGGITIIRDEPKKKNPYERKKK